MNKGRIVMLAHSLVNAIHHYREMHKTTDFVFEGQKKDNPTPPVVLEQR